MHDRFSTVIHYDTGDTLRYKNESLHGVKKPSVSTRDGHEIWFKDGKLHRDDGPAHTGPDNIEEYWIEGVRVSPKIVIDSILANLKREKEHKDLFIIGARNERILRFENSDRNLKEIRELKDRMNENISNHLSVQHEATIKIDDLNAELSEWKNQSNHQAFYIGEVEKVACNIGERLDDANRTIVSLKKALVSP